MKIKLAIVTTHPIQYNAPIFKLLNERGQIEIRVFYTWGLAAIEEKYDPGFDKKVRWDIPLLDGYSYEFLKNTSTEPGSHHFGGVVNPSIIGRLDLFGPDTVMVFGWAFKSHLKVLRHYSKSKIILFRGDSTLLDEVPGWKSIFRQLFLTWVYKKIDYALYVGKNNLQYFIKMGLRKDQLIFGPHAIDNNRFSQNDRVREEEAKVLRRDLGIQDNALVFLFAGKLESKKNIRTLLKVFTNSGLNKRSKIIIVGNGPQEAEIKKEFGAAKSVHFMDFQNQTVMPIVYRMADVFVLPSAGPGETWGLAINEAMACSRAVLVSNRCGGWPDLVDDGHNGFVFNFEDEAELEAKMSMLIDKGREGLMEMGRQSFKKIGSFSFEHFCDATEQLLLGHFRNEIDVKT